MSPKSMHNRRCLVIAIMATMIATTAPTAKASAIWIPDLVFPETVPVPKVKPDRTVSNSTPRIKRTSDAHNSEHGSTLKETRKGVERGSVSSRKEALR